MKNIVFAANFTERLNNIMRECLCEMLFRGKETKFGEIARPLCGPLAARLTCLFGMLVCTNSTCQTRS